MIETYRGLVMAHEVDSNAHMNVQYYTTRFDQANGQLLAKLGFDLQAQKSSDIGFAFVEMNIKYLHEVLEDDPIHIISKVDHIGNKVASTSHQLLNSSNQKLCAEGLTKWLLFDLKKRKAIPIPELLKAKLIRLTQENL